MRLQRLKRAYLARFGAHEKTQSSANSETEPPLGLLGRVIHPSWPFVQSFLRENGTYFSY